MTVATQQQRRMNVVMVGHVDHGKSTVIGRLLADTDALPEGKLEQVRELCRRNAKPFEYAFLLDALKDERSQGITIDTARCFFQTERRPYILIDAPGHIEFLKNMITGAARAEAGVLVIDALEGIQENSKRHGFMISMLGVRQIAVLVNKMDLVDYDEATFERIRTEYSAFLEKIGVVPLSFIPVSGLQGVNIASRATETAWYEGPTLLEQIDAFEERQDPVDLPFRYPVQDVYKFTASGDDRRIVAGTVSTGKAAVGDEVVFYPSGKRSTVKTVEMFSAPERDAVQAGEVAGLTLTTQVYAQRGELLARADEPQPNVASRFRVNLFWMGKSPMVVGRTYKLKLGATRSPIKLVQILNVLDASELTTVRNKQQIDRHDVAECVLETPKPVAFDLVGDIESTGRVVVVDSYEIAGAGIVLEAMGDEEHSLKEHVRAREFAWKPSAISADERTSFYHHGAKFVVLTGAPDTGKEALARALEKKLFYASYKAYYLEIGRLETGLDADVSDETHIEHVRRLGELARIFTDAGQIFITSMSELDDYDLETLKLLNQPHEILVVHVGPRTYERYEPDLVIAAGTPEDEAVRAVCTLLREKNVIMQFSI